MEIQKLLEREYKIKHPGPAPTTEMRELNRFDGGLVFRLYITKNRLEYDQKMISKKKGPDNKCPLCISVESIIYNSQVAIHPNTFPMYEHHMLILPLKQGVRPNSSGAEHVFVDKSMLDCRVLSTPEDIDSHVALVNETDYMVKQNMLGSGASIGSHIHAHALKKDKPFLPGVYHGSFTPLYKHDNILLERIEGPGYGLVIRGLSKGLGTLLDECFRHSNLPFNLLITSVEGRIATFYFPRTAEIPSEKIFGDWQFGLTEMLGVFETKSFEQFHNLSYEDVAHALMGVTVQDKSTQVSMEQFLVGKIKKL